LAKATRGRRREERERRPDSIVECADNERGAEGTTSKALRRLVTREQPGKR